MSVAAAQRSAASAAAATRGWPSNWPRAVALTVRACRRCSSSLARVSAATAAIAPRDLHVAASRSPSSADRARRPARAPRAWPDASPSALKETVPVAARRSRCASCKDDVLLVASKPARAAPRLEEQRPSPASRARAPRHGLGPPAAPASWPPRCSLGGDEGRSIPNGEAARCSMADGNRGPAPRSTHHAGTGQAHGAVRHCRRVLIVRRGEVEVSLDGTTRRGDPVDTLFRCRRGDGLRERERGAATYTSSTRADAEAYRGRPTPLPKTKALPTTPKGLIVGRVEVETGSALKLALGGWSLERRPGMRACATWARGGEPAAADAVRRDGVRPDLEAVDKAGPGR